MTWPHASRKQKKQKKEHSKPAPKLETDAVADAAADGKDKPAPNKSKTDTAADAAATTRTSSPSRMCQCPLPPETSPLMKDVSDIFKPKDRVSVHVVEQTRQPEDVFWQTQIPSDRRVMHVDDVVNANRN